MTVQQHIGGAVLKREQQFKSNYAWACVAVLHCEQVKAPEVPPEAHLPPAEAHLLSGQWDPMQVIWFIQLWNKKVLLEKLVDWIDQGGVWVSRTNWSTACNPRLPPVQCCQKSRYPPTQYNRISTLDILMPMTTCYLLSTSIISYHLVIIENCFIIKWKRKYWDERAGVCWC